jgi:calpain-15
MMTSPFTTQRVCFLCFKFQGIHGDDKKFLKRVTFSRWERISKISADKKVEADVFVGGIDPDDIRQGEIGDCYLLGALGVLATQPKLVRNLITPQRLSPNGIYQIKLFISGKWETIIIDDFLPVDKRGKVIFARSESIQENWVSLIEKAYAKYKGSYKSMENGSMREAMEQLTGGYGDIIDLVNDSRYPQNKTKRRNEIFKDLLKWKNNFALMATSTEFDLDFSGTPTPNKLGIVPCHAYSILNVQEAEGNQLIKLRNPWGRFEWSVTLNPT